MSQIGDAQSAVGSPASQQEAGAKSSMETIEQMKSQLFQVQKLGFKVDAVITPKESEEMVHYRIKSMSETSVQTALSREGHELEGPEILLAEVLEKYRLVKSKITELLPGWDADSNSCSPLSSSVWQSDLAKASISLAMAKLYGDHEESVKNLELLQNPTSVKVKVAYAKGELKLPAASMKIDRKESKSSIPVGLGMHVSTHFNAPLDKHGKANTAKWVCPFWLVGDSKQGDVGPNMVMRYEKVEVMKEQVNVPVLVNSVALREGDTLLWKHGDVPQLGKKAAPTNKHDDTNEGAKKRQSTAGSGRPKKKGRPPGR